ncbi:MAG: LuxR C-terminal-related transcriptional regulator [Anaerolineae bacterium]|nr:LuxR C-terminal-related transcriptional regulator [Candidatus Roseilinea sp.]MDW8451744.1 LuxR C-terminal-related transcriptional regulator [Anaerolineae bacterium]
MTLRREDEVAPTYASPCEALVDASSRLRALCATVDDATLAAELRTLARLLTAVCRELTESPEVTEADGDAVHRAGAPLPVVRLTQREQEVLTLMSRGLRNKEIAAYLGVSERTAAFHVGNVLAKLGADGRIEAINIARALGWLA